MRLEHNKEMTGDILILGKNEEIESNCFKCGKPVETTPFFICETTKRFIHYDCNKILNYHKCWELNKMGFETEHKHHKIVDIKK